MFLLNKSQKKYFEEYVVNDYKKVSRLLAKWGIQTVFTGHYHANDITSQQWNDGSFLLIVMNGAFKFREGDGDFPYGNPSLFVVTIPESERPEE